MLNLLEVRIGISVRLINIENALLTKLKIFGLHIGDYLYVIRIAPMGGPILIDVNGRKIALGREIAKKIFVEVE